MNKDDETFRIEWDLHELGPKEHPTLVRQQSRAQFGRELAGGYVPANAELVDDDEKAA